MDMRKLASAACAATGILAAASALPGDAEAFVFDLTITPNAGFPGLPFGTPPGVVPTQATGMFEIADATVQAQSATGDIVNFMLTISDVVYDSAGPIPFTMAAYAGGALQFLDLNLTLNQANAFETDSLGLQVNNVGIANERHAQPSFASNFFNFTYTIEQKPDVEPPPPPPTPGIPEPSALLLFATGLAAFCVHGRRRRRARS